MAGPVYYGKAYPKYYRGKLFIYDWMRGWIKTISFDGNNNFYKLEPFMQKTSFNAPIDMEVGPDGKLYVLEYGKGWFSKNADAALSRIDFGSTKKNVNVSANSSNRIAVDSTAFKRGHVQKKVVHPGLTAIQKSDCLTCHKANEKSVGPSFNSIAGKYAGDDNNILYLVSKVRNGGAGVWGNVPMAAHPTLSEAEVSEMVRYILSLKNGN
jgi:cytochrome c551/c552